MTNKAQFSTLLLAIGLLLIGSGCAIRATENDVARWHGYSTSERVPQFEGKETERCYSRKGEVRCFDLRTETDVSYEIDEKGCHQ